METSFAETSHLVLVVLLWELDVNVVLRADVGNDGTLSPDDFGVILGFHSDGQLVTPECLQRQRQLLNSQCVIYFLPPSRSCSQSAIIGKVNNQALFSLKVTGGCLKLLHNSWKHKS